MKPHGPGRIVTVAVLLVGLVGAGVLGEASRAFQRRHATFGEDQGSGTAAGGPSLSELDSYALALMLGGLRGPLVMVLWINSENQKIEHDLEGLDTQIEWIRLLQPEFDTVHLFQIWNKAYNISVQMVGLGNKYATILDALDYARGVLQERPNNINILSEVARVYSHKLGTSNEKDYYRQRIRNETMPPIRVTMPAGRVDEFRRALAAVGEAADARLRVQANAADDTASAVLTSVAANKIRGTFAGEGVSYKNVADEILRKGQPGWRRLRMDVLLDEKGYILPEQEHELRYLKPFEPFPYGLSPFPLAYNYAKWAQEEMERTGEDPKQVSRIVISSRPGLELKAWAEESLERSRRFELTAYGLPFPPVDRFSAEVATAGIGPTQAPVNPWAVEPALYAFGRAVQASAAAIQAYDEHLRKPEGLGRRATYQSHLQSLEGLHELARADADYLGSTRAANPVEQQRLLKSAHEHYLAARTIHEDIIIDHYLDKSLLDQYAPGAWDRLHSAGASVMADRSARTPLLRQVLEVLHNRELRFIDTYRDDRNEYERYIDRESQRLRLIESALNLPPSTPELSPFTPVSPLPGIGAPGL